MEKKIQKEPCLRGSFILFIIHVLVALVKLLVSHWIKGFYLFVYLFLAAVPRLTKTNGSKLKAEQKIVLTGTRENIIYRNQLDCRGSVWRTCGWERLCRQKTRWRKEWQSIEPGSPHSFPAYMATPSRVLQPLQKILQNKTHTLHCNDKNSTLCNHGGLSDKCLKVLNTRLSTKPFFIPSWW